MVDKHLQRMQHVSSTSKVDQLLSEVKKLVASVQNAYSKELIPLNDDSIEVHKLCNILETTFRTGMREKYSFTGAKKDYWNFISESLPKEEIIRFITSISDFKTYQGKGRALLRQALMERCLADTLQRCAINEKVVRDYFEGDSVFQDKILFDTLINSLYDLNSVMFNLPYKGYDLDRSWPSFSRKAFYEKKRSNSRSSMFSVNEEIVADLSLNLQNHVKKLDALLRDWDSEYQLTSNTSQVQSPLEFSIDLLMTIHAELVKLKLKYKKLNDDLNVAEQLKVTLQAENDLKIKQLHDHYNSMQKTSTGLSSNRFKLNQSELADLKAENEMSREKCKVYEERLSKSIATNNDLLTKLAHLEEVNKTLKLDINNLTNELSNKNETVIMQEKELSILGKIITKTGQSTLEELKREIQLQIEFQERNIISLNEKREKDLKVTIQELEKKLNEEIQKKNECEGLFKEHKLNAEKHLNTIWQVFIDDLRILLGENMLQDQFDCVLNFQHGKETAIKIIKNVQDELAATRIQQTHAEEVAFGLNYELAALMKSFNDLQRQSSMFQLEIEGLKAKMNILLEENKIALEKNSALEVEKLKKEADFESLKSEYEYEEQALKNEVKLLSEEVKGLQFHLSTTEIKHKNTLKELENSKADYQCLVNSSSENIKNINSLYLEEISSLQEDNRNKLVESLDMKKEFDVLKSEVEKCFKEKQEIQQMFEKTQKELECLQLEKTISDSKYEELIKQIQSDTNDMKEQLIRFAKDKKELWEQKNVLEFTLRSRIENHWMDDKDAEKCMHCLKIFSLAIRKHHCRLCGGIFCKLCSNRWIQTQYSRKKVRSCQTCACLFKNKYSGADDVDGTSDTSSIHNSSVVSSLTNDEEEVNEFSPEDSPFEELDSNDVNSSQIVGEAESISFLENDIKQNAIVPVVHQDSDGSGDLLDFFVTAGTRRQLPLVVGSMKFELVWVFESSPKDIGFGIAYKENEEALDNQIETVIPLSRYISHKQAIHGRMRIDKPGIYVMIFSNSYSRLTPKKVKCSVRLCPLIADSKR